MIKSLTTNPWGHLQPTQPRAKIPGQPWGKLWGLGLGLGFGLGLGGTVLGQTLPLAEPLTDLLSPQGITLLEESTAKVDYIPLSSHFVTQDNQAFCGVATLAMVLNALGLPRPLTLAWDQGYFTQGNVLNRATATIIAPDLIRRQGLTLEQLQGIFVSHGAIATRHHGSEVDLATLRSQWVQNLQTPGDYVVINYLRRAIGQETGGHISPVAAYHAPSDRFLILDVSRYKYPPVWVPAPQLAESLNTLDSTSGQSRGYLLISQP